MKKISKKRLKELGFEPRYRDEFWNNYVFVIYNTNSMAVYVAARITAGEDYARPALGVKNETDLIELCRLVNGSVA
jgi:hypothetical protein